ncbi:MAG: hypothetical protein ACI9W7_000663, partial [Porticoccaceae bacterium]
QLHTDDFLTKLYEPEKLKVRGLAYFIKIKVIEIFSTRTIL